MIRSGRLALTVRLQLRKICVPDRTGRRPAGSVNENKFFNGLPDSVEENLKLLGELGGIRTYNHYLTGWAFNTPFMMWKRYGNLRGGTADPLIVSWPAGIQARRGRRRQYCHAVDIMPTLYEALGVELPEVVNGYPQEPLEGVSFAASFDDASADTGKETQFYSMLGTRALWHRGWKASSLGPAAPNAGGHWRERLQPPTRASNRGPRRRPPDHLAPAAPRCTQGGGGRLP